MRPDEHKKKKNADYKKKHGIPSAKNVSKNEGKKGKASEKETAKVETRKDENIPAEYEQEPRKFSRRKIQSNWDRYDDHDFSDEDNALCGVQQRGADFATLVQEAGTSHSQFRFQDEKDWDDDENDIQDPQAILQINIQELSDSLMSIPLHQRLDLDEMEVNFNLQSTSTAALATSTSDPEYPSNIQTDTSRPAPFPLSTQPSKETTISDLNTPHSSNKTQAISHVMLTSTQKPDASSQRNTFEQKTEQAVTVTANKKLSFKADRQPTDIFTKDKLSKTNPTKPNENEFDNELELLLSLGGKQTNQQLNNSPTKNDMSSVVDFASNDSKEKSTADETGKTADNPVVKKEEDLEDWLDSVLG